MMQILPAFEPAHSLQPYSQYCQTKAIHVVMVIRLLGNKERWQKFDGYGRTLALLFETWFYGFKIR